MLGTPGGKVQRMRKTEGASSAEASTSRIATAEGTILAYDGPSPEGACQYNGDRDGCIP